jgi:hypothetical protein
MHWFADILDEMAAQYPSRRTRLTRHRWDGGVYDVVVYIKHAEHDSGRLE